jgi:hypothetical protein
MRQVKWLTNVMNLCFLRKPGPKHSTITNLSQCLRQIVDDIVDRFEAH